MRLLLLAFVFIIEVIFLVEGNPGKPGADWSEKETSIIFQKILRVFTHTGDAIRKYEKVHGIESENKYEVQKTEPNPAKVSTKYFR